MGVLGMPDSDHKWAYSALIDMMNDRDRAIPDDAAFICGFTGLSRKKWAIVRRYLLDCRNAQGEPDKLILTAAGELTNPRFERERAKRHEAQQASVEGGRKGGLKSAAMRQQGQLSLEDQADDRAIYRPDKQPESRPMIPTKVDDAPQDNNDLAEPPPQGIARASEARGESREEESQRTANPRLARGTAAARSPDRSDPADEPPIDRDTLLTIVQGVARAGGVVLRPERPQSFIAHNLDIVRAWIRDGIDIDRTALPAISRRVARMDPDETAGSIKLFDGIVRKAHARQLDQADQTGPPSRDWTPDAQRAYLAKLNPQGGNGAAPPPKEPKNERS